MIHEKGELTQEEIKAILRDVCSEREREMPLVVPATVLSQPTSKEINNKGDGELLH